MLIYVNNSPVTHKHHISISQCTNKVNKVLFLVNSYFLNVFSDSALCCLLMHACVYRNLTFVDINFYDCLYIVLRCMYLLINYIVLFTKINHLTTTRIATNKC